MIRHYELLYIVGANYTEEELVPIKEKVKKVIEKFEGQITGEDSLGKKKLAYPIKKAFQGYYLIFEFDLPGENLKALNNSLKLTNELLRHLVVGKKVGTPNLAQKTAERIKEAKVKPAEEKTSKKSEENKIKLEDLDQRLDEILGGDII